MPAQGKFDHSIFFRPPPTWKKLNLGGGWVVGTLVVLYNRQYSDNE